MNAQNSDQPRLACRVAHLWAAVGGDAAGHTATCPACQRQARACAELESALRRDGNRFASDWDQAMEARVARAVRLDLRPATAHRSRIWIPLAAAGALALIAVLAIVRPFHNAAGTGSAPTTADAVQLAQSVQALPTRLWTSLKPQATTLMQNDPLRSEATALYSDARSAVGFLAFNFLPANATAQPKTLQPGSTQRG